MKQPVYSVYLQTQNTQPGKNFGLHTQPWIDTSEHILGPVKRFSVTSWVELDEVWKKVVGTLSKNFKLYLTLPLFPVDGFGDFEREKFCLNSENKNDIQKIRVECGCFFSRCKELSVSPLGKLVVSFRSLEHKILKFFAQCVMKNRTGGILCIAAVFSSGSVELIFSLEYEEDLLCQFTQKVLGNFECSIEYCCHSSDVLVTAEKQTTTSKEETLDEIDSNSDPKVFVQELHDKTYPNSSELSDFSDDHDSLDHSRGGAHTLPSVNKSFQASRPRHEKKNVSKTIHKDIKKPQGNFVSKKEKTALKKESVEVPFDSGDNNSRKKTLETKSLPRVALWEILICLAVLVLSMVFLMSFHRRK